MITARIKFTVQMSINDAIVLFVLVETISDFLHHIKNLLHYV